MPPPLSDSKTTMISYPLPGEDAVGYVEVKATEDPTGELKDEIIIVLPLRDQLTEDEGAGDEGPMYYYPKSKAVDDTDSESDSDDEEEDEEEQLDEFDDENPKYNKLALSSQESKELEYTFMEELMQTLDTFFGCAGCSYSACTDAISAPSVLKSALRRKTDGDTATPPIDRSVSFTKLEIREFRMTLGNHPSAVTGPPVMLDWDSPPAHEAIIDLDMYEQDRKPRRNRKELKLSFEARRGILEKERGFTVDEVKKAWSEALMIRKQRMETRKQPPHQRMMDEFWESACRKYNRLFDWKVTS